ncbi:MAG: pyruvoyl-dependent arginine decarboxylase [archaeon]|jgi:arginine decarboxylase
MNCLGTAKKIAIVSGFGESDTSELNAFDNALINAGIHDCNLMPVSSILAKNTRIVKKFDIEKGAFVPCVLSSTEGKKNQTICTGISIGINNKKYGFVVEGQTKSEKELNKELDLKLEEMATKRKLKILQRKTIIKAGKITKKFGCCVTAVVYLF